MMDRETLAFRLTTVRIRNFRCIRDLTLDLDETTVLIGENNSGKTAVLKAIHLCLGRRRGSDGRLFEEYDYHLADETASPEAAPPITIALQFVETAPDAMGPELREELAQVLVVRKDDRRQMTLRVISRFDSDQGEFVTESAFLDADGAPMRPANAALLAAVRRAVPAHFLSALRDVRQHFTKKGQFWREFLSAQDLAEADREAFEKEFTALNRRLIEAHPSLREVRDHLRRAQGLIVLGPGDPVTVDALPAGAAALLSQARVNIASREGATIPLDHQGEGAQSLAVLLLCDAYLRRRLREDGGVAQPITILEEPEAHLHPAAVRVLMGAVRNFPGQKLLSTHSGDLLGAVDPGSVRRLVHRDGGVRAYRAEIGAMDRKHRQTFRRKIQRGRGDLLFARCWLVYEGETEAILFPGVAEALGENLDRYGVAGVQCSDINTASLLRVANQFGIPWYLVYDDDRGKAKYEPAAVRNLDGALDHDRYVCPYTSIEALLKKGGFAHVYDRDVNKVDAANRVVERMVSKPETVPAELRQIVRKTISLAQA